MFLNFSAAAQAILQAVSLLLLIAFDQTHGTSSPNNDSFTSMAPLLGNIQRASAVVQAYFPSIRQSL